MNKQRCEWCVKSDIEREYHDNEWGQPATSDRVLFEFLTLEAAQAGLSWITILKKRDGYRRCFADFDPQAVAAYTEKDAERLLEDASIVRNRKKIEAAISNARIFLEIASKHGSFARWFWNFNDGKPVINHWIEMAQVPATTPLSDTIAKELKRLGFKFLGSTVIYAHMQATGMVNDHVVSCFRHAQIKELCNKGLSF